MNFGSKKFLGPSKKRNFVKKYCGPETTFESKKNNFGLKIIFGPIEFWVQQNFGSNKIGVQQNFGSNMILGVTRFWVLQIFWSNKI